MSLSASPALRVALNFIAHLVRFRPGLLAAVLAITILNGALEAATFTALVPVLASIGIMPSADAEGTLAAGIDHLVRMLGGSLSFEGALALFFAALMSRAALGYLNSLLSAHYVASHVDEMRRRAYAAFSRANWLYLASTRQSHNTHALTMQADSVGHAVLNLIMLFSAATMTVAGMLVAFLVSPRLTLVVLAVSALLSLMLVALSASAYQRGKAALETMQRLYETLSSRMSGLKVAKAFAIELALEREFAKASDRHRASVIGVREDNARARLLQDWSAALTLVLLVYVSVRVLSVPGIELLLLIAICGRLLPLVRSLQLTGRSLIGLLPEYESLKSAMASAQAAAEELIEQPRRIAIAEQVELRGINFAYPGSLGHQVLRDVSLTIPAGLAVGIIGPSGSGKSTLADILAGLIVPDSGVLLVDGRSVTPEMRGHWRSGVAYVSQDATLFCDTVRANLTIAAPGVTDDEVWRCLALVKAADLVRSLPEGLDATIGDRAVRLSGGQRQRLRLASALLRKPELLILDEATSALSPEDELEIIPALRWLRGTTTVVVIAHRVSSIAWTDHTIAIDRGRILSVTPTKDLDPGKTDLSAVLEMSEKLPGRMVR